MNEETKQWIITTATGFMARAITKALIAYGAYSTAQAQTQGQQIATAAVTLVVFGIELWQSRTAHKLAKQAGEQE